MPLDPATDIGKIRLRIGDYKDLPILPDAVIQSALDSNNGSVTRAASLCAQYILASLSSKTHRRMTAALEVWGGEQFTNYLAFLKATIMNPAYMDSSFIPATGSDETNPLSDFVSEWNASYCNTRGSVIPGDSVPSGFWGM